MFYKISVGKGGINLQNIHAPNLDDLLHDKKIPIRISCLKPNGYPLVISLWYVAIENKIYCATQKNAKIISFIQKNPLCGFEIASDSPPYRGIRGDGTVTLSYEKGEEILDVLIDKYLGTQESNLSKFLRKNSSSEVAIVITPKNIVNYDYSKRMKDVVLRKDRQMKDNSCPTCGSKKFEIVKKDNRDGKNIFEKHCSNCKKFWLTED